MVEFADHLHEHFIDPIRVEKGHYCAPEVRSERIECVQARVQ